MLLAASLFTTRKVRLRKEKHEYLAQRKCQKLMQKDIDSIGEETSRIRQKRDSNLGMSFNARIRMVDILEEVDKRGRGIRYSKQTVSNSVLQKARVIGLHDQINERGSSINKSFNLM